MQEDRIPFGVVFIAVGLILLMTTIAVWVLRPELMPQPIYRVAAPYLVPTTLSVLPPTLLPETPTNVAIEPEEKTERVVVEETAVSLNSTTRPRLTIPRINLDASIETVSLQPRRYNGQTFYQWQVPNSDSVGWHDRSAQLGEPGNTVFNGHHNVHGEVFRDLSELSEGDEIFVYDGEQTHSYQVTTHLILEERGQPLETRLENANWINPTEDERLTLITCWPYTSNSHRIVVVAHPVEEAIDS